jgi:uncharacterized membrane protein YhhN
MASIFKNIFFVIAILEILSHLNFMPFSGFSTITKPMLLPVLALYFYTVSKNTSQTNTRFVMFIALFFAWLGDVFLMVAAIEKQFFLAGLAAFLVMQLLYIYLFKGFTTSGLSLKYGLALGIVVFAVIVICYLFPKLGVLKVPVTFYFLAILSMVLSALDFSINKAKSMFVFSGAVLFMISDSLIAINKFQSEIDYSSFLIMATYIAAQWFIVEGFGSYLGDIKRA